MDQRRFLKTLQLVLAERIDLVEVVLVRVLFLLDALVHAVLVDLDDLRRRHVLSRHGASTSTLSKLEPAAPLESAGSSRPLIAYKTRSLPLIACVP